MTVYYINRCGYFQKACKLILSACIVKLVFVFCFFLNHIAIPSGQEDPFVIFKVIEWIYERWRVKNSLWTFSPYMPSNIVQYFSSHCSDQGSNIFLQFTVNQWEVFYSFFHGHGFCCPLTIKHDFFYIF